MIFTRNLSMYSTGADVLALQRCLQALGYGEIYSPSEYVPIGIFGPKTRQAVINFQEKNGIRNTGFFGDITMALMNSLTDPNREFLYQVAKRKLGVDVTPDDKVSDEYACAEVVNAIYRRAFGHEIGGTYSTSRMYNDMLTNPDFQSVSVPLRGDICVSPTGYGNGKLSNGHIGIISDNGKIMSNNSFNGLFEENYDTESWKRRYVDLGGFPMIYFRVV